MNESREAYERKIRERSAQIQTPEPAQKAQETFTSKAQDMGSSMASSSAQQGNLAGTLGGGLMMTGNPYAMAAGLGIQVLAAGEANKRAAEEQQRREYNERIMRRQEMMSRIASMGIE
jgi:hypothetical protein